MRLFWMEMKKIFSWKLLLLIGVVNVLLFYLLLSFELEYFPNGRPATDIFTIEQQIIPKYGPTINEGELNELKAIYNERVKAGNLYFANDAEAQQLEIENYLDFRNFDSTNEELAKYHSNLMFNSKQDFIWELQAWESLIKNYEARTMALTAEIDRNAGSRQKHFEKQLVEEKFSFYSSTVLENFMNYKTNMSIIILISIAILMSPIFLRDYQSGLVPIQYTSKIGRNIYRIKLLAGISSSALLTVLLLAVYVGLYWTNDTSSHFELPLTSFGWHDFWYDMTFFKYILISVAAIFFMAILLGVLSMTISTIVSNTIVLVGVQIITLFIMIAGVSKYLVRDIMNIWLPQALIPTGYAVMTVVILIFGGLIWKRELRKNIV